MKRQRGRGGRKPNGQANRHFESNGPDVKIRGAASHICDKYQQLARDAASSGDRVMAENYLQHAEHYFRLVQGAQRAQRDRDDADAANSAQPHDGGLESVNTHEASKNGDGQQPADSGPMEIVAPETEGLVSDDAPADAAPARRPRARRARAANGAAAAETAEAREALDAASDAADSSA